MARTAIDNINATALKKSTALARRMRKHIVIVFTEDQADSIKSEKTSYSCEVIKIIKVNKTYLKTKEV